jgi:hypothetical protein
MPRLARSTNDVVSKYPKHDTTGYIVIAFQLVFQPLIQEG